MSKAGQNYEYATHNLWDLCFRGDLKAARKALDRGIDANVRNKTGWTPLHAACSGNHVKLIELLLRAGCDLDATDNGGRSAMHEASKSGSLAAVKALHKAGARTDAKDNKGQLPFHVAKGEGIRNYLQSFSAPAGKKSNGLRDAAASSGSGGAGSGHSHRDGSSEDDEEDGPSVRDRSKGRSFARGDDGCCRSVRKVRYSTKQKKEIIKERRRRQREEAEAAEGCGEPNETKDSNYAMSRDIDSLEGQSPPLSSSTTTAVGSWRCSVKGGHASGRGLGLVPWQHDDGLEWTAPLRPSLGSSSGKEEASRDPDRLCEASTGLPVASEGEAGHGDDPNHQQQKPVILRRPAWQGRAATKEELHELEEEAWGDWIDGLEAADKASGRRLNFFEASLPRWRMLWVSAERADVAVMVVDARYPLLHFSSDMYEYLVNDLHKRVVIVMTKADLTPRAAVEAWSTYLSRRFPDIRGVVALCTHSQDPGQARKLCEMLQQCIDSPGVGGGQGAGQGEPTPSDASDAGGDCDDGPEGRGCVASSSPPSEQRAKHVVVLGDANVGKSSLVNFLMQRKAVATSANPNTTKVLQTHHLQRDGHAFVLYDLPATTAPRAGVPKPLEVLFGTYPVSQCPDPYSCLRYLAEHCRTPLQQAYQLTDAAHARSSAPAESDSPDIPCDGDQGDDGEEGGSKQSLEGTGGSHAEPDASQCSSADGDADADGDVSDRDGGDDDGEGADLGVQGAAAEETPLTGNGTEAPSAAESAASWSPYGLAAAYAAKMKWYLRRRGEPDAFRAANCMLKDAIRGRPVLLAFWPPPLLPDTSRNDGSEASNDVNDDDLRDEKAAPTEPHNGRHRRRQLLLLLLLPSGAGLDSEAPSTSSEIVD